MLIVALVGVFILYVALYFFYEAAGPHINTPPSLLVSLREMLFSLPQSAGLSYLKLGLILFTFYVIIDGLRAAMKRRRNR